MRDDQNIRSWNNRNVFDHFKRAGINTDRIFGLSGSYNAANQVERYFNSCMNYKWLKENYGADCEYYLIHGDEPSPAWVAQQRPTLSVYAKAGFKVELAGSDALYHRGADIFDYVRRAGFLRMPGSGAVRMGADVSVRSARRPENPAFNRLQYGFIQYRLHHGQQPPPPWPVQRPRLRFRPWSSSAMPRLIDTPVRASASHRRRALFTLMLERQRGGASADSTPTPRPLGTAASGPPHSRVLTPPLRMEVIHHITSCGTLESSGHRAIQG